jgi:hypothetical protein
MRSRSLVLLAALALGALPGAPAEARDPLGPQALAQILPGHSTKAELTALLGAPWRIVQFDDCGQAMAGQADETWEYRGSGPDGAYRLHVEFDDRGVVHLIAEIPDNSGAHGAIAVVVPDDAALCLSM